MVKRVYFRLLRTREIKNMTIRNTTTIIIKCSIFRFIIDGSEVGDGVGVGVDVGVEVGVDVDVEVGVEVGVGVGVDSLTITDESIVA